MSSISAVWCNKLSTFLVTSTDIDRLKRCEDAGKRAEWKIKGGDTYVKSNTEGSPMCLTAKTAALTVSKLVLEEVNLYAPPKKIPP